jgi:hypothetical protein
MLSVLNLVEKLYEVKAFDECSSRGSYGRAFCAVTYNERSTYSSGAEDVCLHFVEGAFEQLCNVKSHFIALLRDGVVL